MRKKPQMLKVSFHEVGIERKKRGITLNYALRLFFAGHCSIIHIVVRHEFVDLESSFYIKYSSESISIY